MLRSLPLDPQPTARQTREILFHVGHEMAALGARVDHNLIGGFRFRLPPLWRSKRATFLMAISSGRITIGADSGEPWRIRYELKFTALLSLAFALSALLIFADLQWARVQLLDTLVVLWAVAYALPFLAADAQFRRWLATTAAAASVTRVD